jgi:hypothetical protein
MHYLFDPGLAHMAGTVAATIPVGYALAWLVEKLLLKRTVDDRIAGIALGCVIVFLLIMAGATAFLTWYAGSNPFEHGPIVIPPLGYTLSFIAGLAVVGAIRMIVFGREYEESDEALVFDHDIYDQAQYDDEVLAWDEKNRGRNYFSRHWAGHLSLPVSYWVNGALLSALIAAAVEHVGKRYASEGGSLKGISIVLLVYLAVSGLLWVWSSVGIWRSAYWHRRRGGTPGWGFAARTMIVISILATLLRSGDLALATTELGTLARGRDSLGEIARMSIGEEGSALLVQGKLAAGSAERFEKLLADSPAVKVVVLTSPGGRMLEAERIAALVRSRGLETRVDDHCMSACTSILLAGRVRTAPEDAKIGFHQPSFPGLSSYALSDAIEKTRAEYLAAGVNEMFVAQAMATPAQGMWFPGPEELVEARVLTSSDVFVTEGPGAPRRETLTEMRLRRQMKAFAEGINSRGPVRLDPSLTMEGATSSGTTLTQHYRVELQNLNVARSRANMTRSFRQEICSDAKTALAVSQGGRFVLAYKDGKGRPLFDVVIASCTG